MIGQLVSPKSRSMAGFFNDHPRSLGMSWAEHGVGALVIGGTLVGAGLACIIHAFVPGIFTETAGRTVKALNERMTHRRSSAINPDWPEYEI